MFSLSIKKPSLILVYTLAVGLVLASSFRLHAQSLEDKVSQAKKLQAQSMLGVDEATLDSAIAQKKSGNLRGAKAGTAETSVEFVSASDLDLLIAGPKGSLDPKNPDSVLVYDTLPADSTGKRRLIPHKKKRIPKRYEQRIFQSIDRSAFGTTFG